MDMKSRRGNCSYQPWQSQLVSCSDDASIRLWDLECYRTRQLPNQIADRENPTFASEIAKFPGTKNADRRKNQSR